MNQFRLRSIVFPAIGMWVTYSMHNSRKRHDQFMMWDDLYWGQNTSYVCSSCGLRHWNGSSCWRQKFN